MPHLAPPPRLLIATEGQRGVKDVIRVNPHRASPEFSGNCVRFTDIPCPHPGGQAVLRVRDSKIINHPKESTRRNNIYKPFSQTLGAA